MTETRQAEFDAAEQLARSALQLPNRLPASLVREAALDLADAVRFRRSPAEIARADLRFMRSFTEARNVGIR